MTFRWLTAVLIVALGLDFVADVSAGDEEAGAEPATSLAIYEVPPFGDAMVVPVAERPQKSKESGLTLEVEFEPREYLLGEPILARFSLANYSEAPITIAFGWRSFMLDCQRRIERIPSRSDEPGPQPRTIPAGWRLVESYNLVDEYQLSQPGAYTATLRYESDGTSRNPGNGTQRTDHWKGKLKQVLGEFSIVSPARHEDKAALVAMESMIELRAKNQRLEIGSANWRFRYFFSVYDTPRFGKFVEEHGRSRYARYARYGDSHAALLRSKNTSSGEFAKPAIEALGHLDPKECPPLLAEQRYYYLINAHRLVGSRPEEIKALTEELQKQYPHSPYVALVTREKP